MTHARTILKTIALTIGLGLATASSLARPAMAAQPLTDATVAQAIASAKTPPEYEAIAGYFRDQAKREGETVALHESMMKSWEVNVRGTALDRMRQHCRGLITEAHKMQKQYEAIATEYDALAKAAH
jgi:hypothetical protein